PLLTPPYLSVQRPPMVSSISFTSIRRIYLPRYDQLSRAPFHCRVTLLGQPSIRFLFVGSTLCLRLPSALPSRTAPCLQLTIPADSARSGLSPYGCSTSIAQKAG